VFQHQWQHQRPCRRLEWAAPRHIDGKEALIVCTGKKIKKQKALLFTSPNHILHHPCQTLDLSRNHLKADAVPHLAAMIPGLPSLTWLNLSNNALGEAVEGLWPAIGQSRVEKVRMVYLFVGSATVVL
jgi:hypothetical protein